IDSIQVRKFDWKEDNSHQEYGFIAQELEQVFAYAVHTAQNEMQTKSVDYASLVPMMLKEIQSLRNRVAQLEE
ncbi:MAG: tail fiber domain-containing protein, partial [Gammaproteobacteria bacterium]|nr:tail fiber domain-containing protein [Gammaproteobacteria bacterium]